MMVFDPGFLDLMPSTVRVSTMVSSNDYGEAVFSTAFTAYRCRIEYNPTLVTNSLGEEVMTSATVYAASTTHLRPVAEYTIPDGSGQWISPPVTNVVTHYDEDGVHHCVIYLGAGGG